MPPTKQKQQFFSDSPALYSSLGGLLLFYLLTSCLRVNAFQLPQSSTCSLSRLTPPPERFNGYVHSRTPSASNRMSFSVARLEKTYNNNDRGANEDAATLQAMKTALRAMTSSSASLTSTFSSSSLFYQSKSDEVADTMEEETVERMARFVVLRLGGTLLFKLQKGEGQDAEVSNKIQFSNTFSIEDNAAVNVTKVQKAMNETNSYFNDEEEEQHFLMHQREGDRGLALKDAFGRSTITDKDEESQDARSFVSIQDTDSMQIEPDTASNKDIANNLDSEVQLEQLETTSKKRFSFFPKVPVPPSAFGRPLEVVQTAQPSPMLLSNTEGSSDNSSDGIDRVGSTSDMRSEGLVNSDTSLISSSTDVTNSKAVLSSSTSDTDSAPLNLTTTFPSTLKEAAEQQEIDEAPNLRVKDQFTSTTWSSINDKDGGNNGEVGFDDIYSAEGKELGLLTRFRDAKNSLQNTTLLSDTLPSNTTSYSLSSTQSSSKMNEPVKDQEDEKFQKSSNSSFSKANLQASTTVEVGSISDDGANIGKNESFVMTQVPINTPSKHKSKKNKKKHSKMTPSSLTDNKVAHEKKLALTIANKRLSNSTSLYINEVDGVQQSLAKNIITDRTQSQTTGQGSENSGDSGKKLTAETIGKDTDSAGSSMDNKATETLRIDSLSTLSDPTCTDSSNSQSLTLEEQSEDRKMNEKQKQSSSNFLATSLRNLFREEPVGDNKVDLAKTSKSLRSHSPVRHVAFSSKNDTNSTSAYSTPAANEESKILSSATLLTNELFDVNATDEASAGNESYREKVFIKEDAESHKLNQVKINWLSLSNQGPSSRPESSNITRSTFRSNHRDLSDSQSKINTLAAATKSDSLPSTEEKQDLASKSAKRNFFSIKWSPWPKSISRYVATLRDEIVDKTTPEIASTSSWANLTSPSSEHIQSIAKSSNLKSDYSGIKWSPMSASRNCSPWSGMGWSPGPPGSFLITLYESSKDSLPHQKPVEDTRHSETFLDTEIKTKNNNLKESPKSDFSGIKWSPKSTSKNIKLWSGMKWSPGPPGSFQLSSFECITATDSNLETSSSLSAVEHTSDLEEMKNAVKSSLSTKSDAANSSYLSLESPSLEKSKDTLKVPTMKSDYSGIKWSPFSAVRNHTAWSGTSWSPGPSGSFEVNTSGIVPAPRGDLNKQKSAFMDNKKSVSSGLLNSVASWPSSSFSTLPIKASTATTKNKYIMCKWNPVASETRHGWSGNKWQPSISDSFQDTSPVAPIIDQGKVNTFENISDTCTQFSAKKDYKECKWSPVTATSGTGWTGSGWCPLKSGTFQMSSNDKISSASVINQVHHHDQATPSERISSAPFNDKKLESIGNWSSAPITGFNTSKQNLYSACKWNPVRPVSRSGWSGTSWSPVQNDSVHSLHSLIERKGRSSLSIADESVKDICSPKINYSSIKWSPASTSKANSGWSGRSWSPGRPGSLHSSSSNDTVSLKSKVGGSFTSKSLVKETSLTSTQRSNYSGVEWSPTKPVLSDESRWSAVSLSRERNGSSQVVKENKIKRSDSYLDTSQIENFIDIKDVNRQNFSVSNGVAGSNGVSVGADSSVCIDAISPFFDDTDNSSPVEAVPWFTLPVCRPYKKKGYTGIKWTKPKTHSFSTQVQQLSSDTNGIPFASLASEQPETVIMKRWKHTNGVTHDTNSAKTSTESTFEQVSVPWFTLPVSKPYKKKGYTGIKWTPSSTRSNDVRQRLDI